MKKLIVLFVLMFLLVACQGGNANEPSAEEPTAMPTSTTEPGTELTLNLNEPFALPAGETVGVADTGLYLTFTNVVEDSRCPTDVECFWTGRAVVEMEVQAKDDTPQTITFDTNPAPSELRDTIAVAGYAIHLQSLDPYPKTPDPISFADYVATVIVTLAAEESMATKPAPQSTPEPDMRLDEPFVLAAGQTVTMTDTGLRLTFISVTEDSRCPTQVTCVWAGQVIIELEVQSGSEPPQTMMIQTPTNPSGGKDTIEVSGYTIFLENVAPYPADPNVPIPLADYRVTLVVSQP